MKLLTTVAIIVTSIAVPVHAEEPSVCMKTKEMEAALLDWYGERPTIKRDDGSIIWASAAGGTWTIVSYEPNGTSCTVAQGDNWSPNLIGDDLMARLNQSQG